MNTIRKFKLASTVAVFLALVYTQSALAVPVYEALPSSNSTFVSQHTVGGPVLADDFASSTSGLVSMVEWWGGRAASTSWEITFHNDAGGTPDTTFPTGVITQHIVNVTGTDLDGDGIFHYNALWNPMDMFITAGTDYWFSVANFDAGWTWANAFAPTVGSEQYNAMESTGIGPDGGPHFGPWTAALDAAGAPTDFAFRISVVPEPGILALLGIGLAGIGFARKRKIA